MSTATIAGSNACPSFFRASCHEASQGGSNGYAWAGYNLTGAIPKLAPDTMEDDDWMTLVDEFLHLVCPDAPIGHGSGGTPWGIPDDDAVVAWLDRWLPRCMKLVPRRRRLSFLQGIYRYIRDEEGDMSL